jgi:hypothetical protein
MEKAVLIVVFVLACAFLAWRWVRALRKAGKNECGPDCNCS